MSMDTAELYARCVPRGEHQSAKTVREWLARSARARNNGEIADRRLRRSAALQDSTDHRHGNAKISRNNLAREISGLAS
jgi:hypothetical protein